LDNQRGFAIVLDVSKPLARELHVAFGREWFRRVGKLSATFQAVIEKGDHAFVVVEHVGPSEHLARRIYDADALGKDLGPANLTVQPAFLVVGRIIDQAGLKPFIGTFWVKSPPGSA
jgi:hypothetical protein